MSHTESYLNTATSEMNGAQPPVDYYIRSMIQSHLDSSPFLEKGTQVRELTQQVLTSICTSLQTDQSGCVE